MQLTGFLAGLCTTAIHYTDNLVTPKRMTNAPSMAEASHIALLLLLHWPLPDRRNTESMRATLNIREVTLDEERRLDQGRPTEFARIAKLEEIVRMAHEDAHQREYASAEEKG